MRIVLTEFARPRLFPRQPRRNTLQDIDAAAFERECRIIAEQQIAVPVEANFRVGLDDEGQVAGATFQFFDLNKDDIDS